MYQYNHHNGDIWVEEHTPMIMTPQFEEKELKSQYFVFGHVDDHDFIIDGPWDSYDAALGYLERHKKWAKAVQLNNIE